MNPSADQLIESTNKLLPSIRWVEDALKEDPDFFKKLKSGQVGGSLCVFVGTYIMYVYVRHKYMCVLGGSVGG